jgi:hydrogenase-4 component F
LSPLGLVVAPAVQNVVLWMRVLRARACLGLLAVALLVSAFAWIRALSPSLPPTLGGYVVVDATSRLFLATLNPIFLGICFYVQHRVLLVPALRASMGRFVPCALTFLFASNAVLIANHLLVLWIALEASALSACPIIAMPATRAARQAAFRYLLFSCVGLGLVLLGLLCISRELVTAGHAPTFFLDQLEALRFARVNGWGRLGVALAVLGLGTKLGLAPMYSWLPEVYEQSPPAVTALLGAVQFNLTLVMLLRVVHVFRPSQPGVISAELITMGLVSMAVATCQLIATRNVKRLVAYASINHAGAIAIGLGIGGSASYGVLLYVISNAFIKAVLFLTTGKIKAHYNTTDTRQIAGLLKDLPYSGVFLMVGTFALLGFPPFGSFLGELLILSALVESGRFFVFAALCVLVTMSFVGTGRTVFPMIWGEPSQRRTWPRQTFAAAVPKMLFLLVLVILGVYIPSTVNDLIQQVAASVEGS